MLHNAVGQLPLLPDSTVAEQEASVNGLVTAVRSRSNLTTTFGYDGLRRRISVTGDFDYTRLANSDLVSQMTRPNGVTTTWTYEANRNLITQVQNGAISTYGYTNDAIGRRTSMSRAGSAHPTPDTITYSYNDRSEVTGAVSDVDASYAYAYAYDPIGNRISASEAGVPWTYTTNQLNQYASATENNVLLTFAYDLDGSMTYRPVDATTGWTQVWNGENRMVETYKGDDRLTFQYDYMGRRVEKKVYDGQTLTTHLKFVYDGFKLVEELNGADNNTSLRRYTWQPDDVGLDVVLQMTDVPNAAHSFHLHDANKNVVQLATSSGAIASAHAYGPFGTSVITTPQTFGFSSEFLDDSHGLIYFNYRYVFQTIGRWINRDPIGEIYENSVYAFTGNKPVYFYDYFGLICCGNDNINPETQCCINNRPVDKFNICVNVDGSHAWISTENKHTNERHTYGRWKKGTRRNGDVIIDESGVHTDLELTFTPEKQRCKIICGYTPTINNGFGIDVSYWNPINIFLRNFVDQEAPGARRNNCSTYACNEFNRATGEYLTCRSFMGCADTPEGLGRSIDRANKYGFVNPYPYPYLYPYMPYMPYM